MNDGKGQLRFRILSDKRWASAEPAHGTVAPGASHTITVKIGDLAASAGDSRATLTVLSNGGSYTVPVSIPARVDGTYRGALYVTSPVPTGTYPFAISVLEDAAGALTGIVDADRSPAHALHSPIAGARASTGEYDLKIEFTAKAGSRLNPNLGMDIGRSLTLKVKLVSNSRLEGTFVEEFRGPYEETFTIAGTVTLRRAGGRLNRMPEILPGQLSSPVPPSSSLCATCPNGSPCPGDPLAAGQQFLQAAMPLYQGYPTQGYALVSSCVSTPSGCINFSHLRCAQLAFHAAYQANPSATCAAPNGSTILNCPARGLLDTMKAQVHWRSLLANELLVQGHQWGASLSETSAKAEAARITLLHGLVKDPSSGMDLRTPTDLWYLRFIDGLPASYFSTNTKSLVPERLAVGGSSADYLLDTSLADLLRPLEQLAMLARASRTSAEWRHRIEYASGTNTQSLAIAQRSTADVYNLGAIFGEQLKRRGQAQQANDALASEATQLAALADAISDGLNPAGVSDDVVPYVYDPRQSGPNNFAQIHQFTEGGPLQLALTDEAQAKAATRDFESSQAALSAELSAQVSAFNDQLFRICGGTSASPNVAECGASSGELHEARAEIAQAHLRIELARDAVERTYAAIEIEENRAAQIAGLHKNSAQLILVNGKKELALQDREQDLQRIQLGASTIGNILGAAATGNPGGAGAAAVNGIVGLALEDSYARIAEDRARMATREKAKVEFNSMQATLIDSAAQVKTMLLDIPGLLINAEMAAIDAARAAARFQLLSQTVANLVSERDRFLALKNADPRADPAFRTWRDKTGLRAEESFREAQKWAFFATRALEYDLNYSYGPKANLFLQPSADDLNRYMVKLLTDYNSMTSALGVPQRRTLTISLRRDVLGIREPLTDSATGVTYSEAELFRRYIADPRRRDAQGNLRLEFSLSIGEDSEIFATNVCNDRLVGIKASLVGAQLGVSQGVIELTQRGTGLLRSCTEKDGAAVPLINAFNIENTLGVRKALVQAGINLSGAMDPNAPPENLELHGRPVGAQWVLRIDQQSSPENRALDLRNLDDIVLFVTHETNTVQ